MVQVEIFPDRQELLICLAKAFLKYVANVLSKDTNCRVIFGGGRTPVELNNNIVQKSHDTALDWNGLHIYFSDERMVPSDHPDNTAAMILKTLVFPLNIPVENVHPVRTDLSPRLAAERCEQELISLRKNHKEPMFHLALLGIGPDGHTASLFPGSPALKENKRYVAVAGKGPEGWDRVTMTFKTFKETEHIWIIASGKEKRGIVDELINSKTGSLTYPIQGVQPAKGSPLLWVDKDTLS